MPKPAFIFCKIDKIQYISRYCKTCLCLHVYNIARASHIQGMYHGADRWSGGLAVWTLVSATSGLLLTQPDFIVIYVVWPKCGFV